MSQRPYSEREEALHTLAHGIGLIGALAATPFLVAVAAGDRWRVISATVFGLSAALVFATSVLYHSARRPELRLRLRLLDHAAIFLLIAGSYTPFAIGVTRSAAGWTIFAAIWTTALLGIVAKVLLGFRFPYLSTALYLAMGWLGATSTKGLFGSLGSEIFAWVLAGGLSYTIGVPFYLWKSRAYTHTLWHLFVLGGVACHFVAVYLLLRDT
jgi:hemolysin III